MGRGGWKRGEKRGSGVTVARLAGDGRPAGHALPRKWAVTVLLPVQGFVGQPLLQQVFHCIECVSIYCWNVLV